MPSPKGKYLIYLLLLLFAIPLFCMNIHSYHQWGDDYAQYIKEAQNIVAGKPYYQSNYIYNPLNTSYSPALYPPGFPLLLAPIVLFWGLNIKVMLYYITLFLAALLLTLYSYFKKSSNTVTAICLSLIVVYCSYIIDFKQHVLSDIPCLLFVSIYLNLRKNDTLSAIRIVLLICMATIAILIRSQAVLLLIAEGVLLAIGLAKRMVGRKLSLKKAMAILIVIAGTAALYFVIDKLIFHTPSGSDSFYKNIYLANTNYLHIVLSNILYLCTCITLIFHHSPNGFVWEAMVFIIEYTGLAVGIAGLIITLRKRLLMEDIFFLLMCLLILITPVHDGMRYFLPAVPVCVYYCKEGAKAFTSRFVLITPSKVAFLFTFIYLFLGYHDYKETTHAPGYIWSPNTKADTAAFKYLVANTGKDDVILFSKPRVLTLYTNKKAMVIAYTASFEESKRQIDSMHIKYLLWRSDVSEPYFKDYLSYTHSAIDSYKINDLYTLYTLRHN